MRHTAAALLTLTAVVGLVALATGAPIAAADAKAPQTFTGWISDDMCGLDHGDMGKQAGGDRACTLKCVHDMGVEFVLADREHKKVYKLDDQKKPEEFAGAKVVVTGTLDGETIHVQAIKPAK